MYDELVKRLRMRARLFKQINQMENCIMDEAANAIEELTALSSRQEVELVKLTGELASKPRWISVTERLPEPYVEVLLYSGEDRYTGYMHNDKRFTVNASHYPDRPTHWMPLPEPPKEET